MVKKRNLLIITVCVILLLISVLALFATVFTLIYTKKNINFENDEMFFSLSKSSTITEYYTDAGFDAATLSDYNPILSQSIVLGDNRKRWVKLSSVPSDLINGFLAMEDRKFYSHSGFDPIRTVYAAFNSIFGFKKTFGASTITQQVIKNISGDNEVTLKRKYNEIIRANNLEKNHTKDEILEVYLNVIPFGENITGVSFACENYFGKDVSEITLSEAATLVGITNAPTKYNPHLNYDSCLKKRNSVLYAMFEYGVIGDDEYNKAINEKLNVLPIEKTTEEPNSWFVETVNEDVIEALSKKFNFSRAVAESYLLNGGLKIYTTENTKVQNILEEYFKDKSHFSKHIEEGLDYSMAICNSKTGDLVAIVGSVGSKSGNRLLNLATSPHTPGSALKPLALYAPLINNEKINWATIFDDVPQEFNKKGNSYVEYPKNYPNVYDGLITVSDALRLSKNTVAVNLYNMLGAETIYRSLKQDFGFNTLILVDYDKNGNKITDLAEAPLALGQLSYGVSLRNLTEAYTVFPKEGVYSRGRSFIAVYDSEGRLLIDNSQNEKRIFSKESTRVMNQLLMNVTESGTASKVTLKNTVDTAGKTGTSGDDKDRLFIGYTPYYTAGIWCGYRKSDKSIGSAYPSHLKIWDEVMKKVHELELYDKQDHEIEAFSKKGLVRREYCLDSGEIYTEKCEKDPRGSRIGCGYFIKSNAPSKLCDRHILCKYDVVSEGIASEYCPEDCVEEISLLLISNRHFPKEIIISDADYVYMDVEDLENMPESYDVPFYYNNIAEGDYVGRGKRKKQFNSYCYIHDE